MIDDPDQKIPTLKPAHPPTIQLNYATPAEQVDAGEQQERERREALENYNESTYGSRDVGLGLGKVFYGMLALWVVFFGVIKLMDMHILSRTNTDLLMYPMLIGFGIWRRSQKRS